VWRLATSEGDATAVRAYEQPAEAHLALFWIPAGHLPSVDEAVEHLAFRRERGDTAVAFPLARPYSKPDDPSADPVVPAVNPDQRLFVSRANTPNGAANGDTRFRYRQSGARIWASYGGGPVRFGALVAAGDGAGRLDMRYHHVGPGGALRTCACIATPELLSDGRVRLTQEWHWTNGDRSGGRSVVEEVG
jgi:hypothetical protein